jgi:hypothetical protein
MAKHKSSEISQINEFYPKWTLSKFNSARGYILTNPL